MAFCFTGLLMKKRFCDRTVAGLNWEGGAIGTAVWSGARLVDVLKAAGIDENDPKVRHVQFEGADHGADGHPYGMMSVHDGFIFESRVI